MASSGVRRVFSEWGFEFFTVLWSVGMFVAMIALLTHFHEKLIFDLHIITLNTIVSMLSTASKVCLLAAISSCVSQEGWVLFSGRPRRLYDLELVAQASRGPLGSFKLLWSSRMKGGMIVRFGALITVLAIAIEPFSQQLVQYRQIFKEVENSSISQAVRYTKGSQTVRFMQAYKVNRQGRVDLPSNQTYLNVAPDFAMQGAMGFSLTASGEAVEQQTTYNCPGTGCRFNEFQSLSVCSRCSNLDSKLERSRKGNGTQLYDYQFDTSMIALNPNSTMYRLPNGLYLENVDDKYGTGGNMVYMMAAGTPDPGNSVAMKDIDTLIWSQSVIRVLADPFADPGETWPRYKVQASECALYYCVKSYNISVTNGTVHQTSVEVEDSRRNPASWKPMGDNENEGKLSEKVLQSLAYHPADSLVDRSDLQLTTGAGQKYNISKNAVDGISYFTQQLFATCLGVREKNRWRCNDAVENWGITNAFYLALNTSRGVVEQYAPNSAKILFETRDLEALFGHMATGMSNALRTGDQQETQSDGITLYPQTVYDVDWRWIALMTFVEAAGLLFFGLAVWSTARTRGSVPVWKSSELAVLAHGTAAHDALKHAYTREEQDRMAMETQVKLTKTPQPEWQPVDQSPTVADRRELK